MPEIPWYDQNENLNWSSESQSVLTEADIYMVLDKISNISDDRISSDLKYRFEKDIKQILEDWILSEMEIDRVNKLNQTIDLLLNCEITDINDIQDEDIDNIYSLRRLIHSRDILDNFWDSQWIQNLKIILGLIEWIWSSNIKENKLEEINILIKSIFDKWIDKSDIVKLEELQNLLLISYDLRNSQIFNTFSLDEEEKVWVDQSEIRSTTELLGIIYDFDKNYGDFFNEKAPSLWLFLDWIATEIKNWLNKWEWNTIWAWLQIFFTSLEKFSEWEYNSLEQIEAAFNKLFLNWLNIARHSTAKVINLIFTWIKELKNYYLKSTWNETEHWVYIQQLHETTDNLDSPWIPDFVATWVDITLTSSMSSINWVSDALLDYMWFVVNILITPDTSLEKIKNFLWDIDTSKIIDQLLNSSWKEFSTEILNKINYLVSYIASYITLWSLTWSWVIWTLNNTVKEWLKWLSNILWKPRKSIFLLLTTTNKISWQITRWSASEWESLLQRNLKRTI